ncbi:hypothetical protein MY10362_001506 [Beauveria mimosiformis]
MKAVIFGATGLVGNEVLNACIATDKIIKVYVVTRRALGDDRGKNPKVDVILHSDFAQYPLELLDRLKGIELCLWAIGGVLSKFNNDKKLAYAANVVYPCAAASAFAQHLSNDSPSGRIRFVFCSGKFAEPDPAKLLWFLGDSRRWKGETETFLQTLAKQQSGRFEAFSVRPGLVIPNSPPPAIRLATVVSPGITAQQTGTVMNSQSHMEDDTTFFPLQLSPFEQLTDFGYKGYNGLERFTNSLTNFFTTLIADMTPEACAARIALLVILSLVFLCGIGVCLYYLIGYLWREWKIYWQGNRTHLNGLQKFRNLWPQQSAADTNPPSSNDHSSAEQSRRLHWRAKVLENLSERKAGASGSGVLQDSVIEPPMPAATTDSRQYVGHIV